MDIEYCYKKCKKGKNNSDRFLKENNSVYDAAIDFWFFVDDCFKTCPHKDCHSDKTSADRSDK